VVNCAIWANRCANVTLCHDKAGRTQGEPLFLAFLAVLAHFRLTVSSPEGKRLLTALFSLLKELGTGNSLFLREILGKLVVGKNEFIIILVGRRLTSLSSLSSAATRWLRLTLFSFISLNFFLTLILSTPCLAVLAAGGRRMSIVDRSFHLWRLSRW